MSETLLLTAVVVLASTGADLAEAKDVIEEALRRLLVGEGR